MISLKDTVHSNRVRKSRRYSDQLVSGENSSAFGKQTWRIGSCGCTGRLLHKKCEVCPEHPLLCSGGPCDGFFLLTLQEWVILGQKYLSYFKPKHVSKNAKISYARRLRPTLMLRGYRKESHWKSKRKAITFWILGSRERLTHVIYDFASVLALLAKESRGKFLKKLWCCVGGRV